MHVCYFFWSHTLYNDRSHYRYCDHTHQPWNAHVHSSTQHATRMSDHIELSRAQKNTPHMSLCGSNYCCFIAKHKHKLSTAASPLHFTYIPLYKTLSLSLALYIYIDSPAYWDLVRPDEAVLYSVCSPLAPPRSAFLLHFLLLSPFIPQNAHHTACMHATRAHVRVVSTQC